MDLNEQDINTYSPADSRLSTMRTILSYEIGGGVLLTVSHLWFFTIFIIIGAAVLFTPFLLFVLYEQRRYGWITSFLLIVLALPLAIALNVPDATSGFGLTLLMIMFPFYAYCGALRYGSRNWI
ncbi:MAG: hypothetical protein ACNA78_08305 [Balneolaceae bacterium]